MATDYEFVSGDTGSVLRVTCVNDDDESAIDLTGATVVLKWYSRAGSLVSQTMTAVTPASGIVSYQFGAGELESPAMSFEVQITDASSKVVRSTSTIDVDVRSAFA